MGLYFLQACSLLPSKLTMNPYLLNFTTQPGTLKFQEERGLQWLDLNVHPFSFIYSNEHNRMLSSPPTCMSLPFGLSGKNFVCVSYVLRVCMCVTHTQCLRRKGQYCEMS
jgi:hypothetical protein